MRGESCTLTSPSQMRQLPAALGAPGLTIRAAHITQHAEEEAFYSACQIISSKISSEDRTVVWRCTVVPKVSKLHLTCINVIALDKISNQTAFISKISTLFSQLSSEFQLVNNECKIGRYTV